MTLDRVAESLLGHDVVHVATPLAVARDDAGRLEISHDPLNRTLGDPHHLGDIAKPDLWVPMQADEYMGVIRQERPRAR